MVFFFGVGPIFFTKMKIMTELFNSVHNLIKHFYYTVSVNKRPSEQSVSRSPCLQTQAISRNFRRRQKKRFFFVFCAKGAMKGCDEEAVNLLHDTT